MMNDILSTVRLISDWGMVILIWMVQVIVYPAFQSIETDRFREWHHQYMRNISYIVMPLMMVQACSIGITAFLYRSVFDGLAIIAILSAWVATFTLSVPCHQQLQEHGNRLDLVKRIVQTNWIRTFAWTLAAIFGLL